MSSLDGVEWVQPDLKVRGISLAGSRTSFLLPELNICFDLAMGLPWQLSAKTIFLSHGHLDHAGGIAFLISQKAMHGHPPPTIYVPSSLRDPLVEILNIWERIEKHDYRYHLEVLRPGERVEINKQYSVEAFETLHRVQSQGYSLLRNSKKLRPEFASKSSVEIAQAQKQGQEVAAPATERLFSFTGDTQIEFLDLAPEVKDSKYLFVEATFIDEAKSIQSARDWGHIHLDELLKRKDELKSEKVVIIHVSGRYSLREAQEILQRKIDSSEQSRFEIFTGR